MNKWTIMAVLGLFLFGCDSDDEEGGCRANIDCAEGEVCMMEAAVAAEGDADLSEVATDEAEAEAAAQAAAAGGDVAAAATGSLLGGDDATATGTCGPAPEVVEPEVVEPEDPTASSLFTSTDENVGAGCEAVQGFCMDTAMDDGACMGGEVVSGECPGGADIMCCKMEPCADKYLTEGVCMGDASMGNEGAMTCDGTLVAGGCPNTSADAGLVGCCIPAAAEEEAAEGGDE